MFIKNGIRLVLEQTGEIEIIGEAGNGSFYDISR